MTLRGLATFNRELERFANKVVPEEQTKLTRTVALELLSRIVKRTPVDTGRARGNWQLDVGASPEGEVNARDGDTAISNGISKLASLRPLQDVHIANNVPYILKLEGGSSQQAPKGMVQTSLAEVRVLFRD